jgi:uncharacterized protein
MSQNIPINYLEFQVKSITESKAFFGELFEWKFEDFGPEYCAFSNAGLAGGFYESSQSSNADDGAMLVVFYSKELEELKSKIVTLQGTIKKDIFTFPGGRRFHFCDPSGNEFAVWSDI